VVSAVSVFTHWHGALLFINLTLYSIVQHDATL